MSASVALQKSRCLASATKYRIWRVSIIRDSLGIRLSLISNQSNRLSLDSHLFVCEVMNQMTKIPKMECDVIVIGGGAAGVGPAAPTFQTGPRTLTLPRGP